MSKDRDKEGRPVFSGEDARQGEIILRTRTRRIIFIAGLVGIVVLALVLSIALR
ncbi:peptide ABC transporter permease [Mesorhizobium sp. ORS 3428]|uniref:peptide ABC transporter permease n=1 Tax=Mesorhizobium sp. ORS 3428 TaxID=540997 RepID=UPI0008D926F5|nr:peptide ABC transporter permease [Mesorhizobium sp. ORS 3428]OHV89328.1 peptide ABC transporter permease [Mesorhizobium sp. ORS 3428]